jgi:DNA-binding protein Fis
MTTNVDSRLDIDRPTLRELQNRYIARIIEATNGNKTAAAAILGIDRRTLQRLVASTVERRDRSS